MCEKYFLVQLCKEGSRPKYLVGKYKLGFVFDFTASIGFWKIRILIICLFAVKLKKIFF